MRGLFVLLAVLGFAAFLLLAIVLFKAGHTLWLIILCFFLSNLGGLKAIRFRAVLRGIKQPGKKRSSLLFWSTSLIILSLISAGGVYSYANYLAKQYELPEVYYHKAPLWLLGINRPLPKLVDIPAGRFEMGSNESKYEEPVHTVTMDYPFKMGQYEVTFEEYDYYIWSMRQRGFTDLEYPDDRKWGRETRPVIYVSWNDAQGYVQWLTNNNQQGLICRLPSEAEWEYAARAGTNTLYPWGNELGKNKANCKGCGSQWDNKQTAPVGSFQPNAWGLYDMGGNVFEWVQDKWHDNYEGAPADGSAWEAGGDEVHVFRGGSWGGISNSVRSSVRFDVFIVGSRYVGFRIVCSPR